MSIDLPHWIPENQPVPDRHRGGNSSAEGRLPNACAGASKSQRSSIVEPGQMCSSEMPEATRRWPAWRGRIVPKIVAALCGSCDAVSSLMGQQQQQQQQQQRRRQQHVPLSELQPASGDACMHEEPRRATGRALKQRGRQHSEPCSRSAEQQRRAADADEQLISAQTRKQASVMQRPGQCHR